MDTSAIVLQIENLGHSYARRGGPLEVLQDVSFQVPRSRMVTVRGASGSGKTTLLLACGAMQKPTSGRVAINQQDVFELSVAKRSQFRAEKIGFLFQTLQLVPYLNVLDNVRIVKGGTSESARLWLARLGLGDRLEHKPESLSHGQCQRVALARALVHRPALVIADEPTGNLDPENTRLVFKTLREFADQGGAVLVASHDVTIEEFSDEFLQLDSGTLVSAKATV